MPSRGANSPRHRPFKPLRQLMLLKRHRQCLKMQLFLAHKLPLWSTHSLASRSNIFRILLSHANKTVTHLSLSSLLLGNRRKPTFFLFSVCYGPWFSSFIAISCLYFYFSWRGRVGGVVKLLGMNAKKKRQNMRRNQLILELIKCVGFQRLQTFNS